VEKTVKFDIRDYYHILSPDFPEFICRYAKLPILQRLAGVGLLCGTDWTPLYHNRFFYSRLDHSIGVALIIWNFTHDRIQSIAGLLHDVSTPAFSHVSDFRNGDVLKQESTEDANARMIFADRNLNRYLREDGIDVQLVSDYHRYPIADNEIPRLSADRLEYMFPSGMVLNGSWDMESTTAAYRDIVLCRNEQGMPEPGFRTAEIAADYCRRCCAVGLMLQKNENKLALQLMAKVLTCALEAGIIQETDCFLMDEASIIQRFENAAAESGKTKDFDEFSRYFKTFRTMKAVMHGDYPQPDAFCVSLDVKKRYIDPLAVCGKKTDGLYASCRITAVLPEAAEYVREFLSFRDTKFGCVPYSTQLAASDWLNS